MFTQPSKIIMKLEIEKNSLTITSKYFSVSQILYSGQVFRFKPYNDGYILIAGKELAVLRQYKDTTFIRCTDENYFKRYFDLDTDYESVIKSLDKTHFLKQATEFGKGIRILKQEQIETLFSFIISANNNIKRISGIIERICEGLGEKLEFDGISYHTFPDALALSKAGKNFFTLAGAGYRAAYIDKTANMLASGFSLQDIEGLETKLAQERLMSLCGVGKKVCDCILLFTYGRQDVFPVDTWIEKVYKEYINIDLNVKISRKEIADEFVNIFGNLSGYAQQYLFYYKRFLNKGEII